MAYQATVVADSVSPDGDRLTTMQLCYPRFVHSELMTHRVFSRNAASSRAIPLAKTIERISADPVVPVEWGRNRPGMQADTVLDDDEAAAARLVWLAAADQAIASANRLRELGVHKQIANRLLEPFGWITTIVSGTDWSGFFRQRASRFSPLAQPELRRVADLALDAYEASDPTPLGVGEWHCPLIQPDEVFADVEQAKEVSAARCARVSYLSHDGTRDAQRDLELYRRLVSARPMHASPLEHVATPSVPGRPAPGNFTGWRQFRHQVEDELDAGRAAPAL